MEFMAQLLGKFLSYNCKKIEMPVAFDTLRVGKKYLIRNYGEVNKVEVMERTSEGDFILKDLLTLERSKLTDFIKYGKGKDFDLYEIR